MTDLSCKKTDCHQYLHYDSCHSKHIKKSSVYSQGLRIKRLCSDSKDCETHLKNLKKWFHDRGYPENVIDNQLKRVKHESREEHLRPEGGGNKNTVIPLIVTYHPHLKHLGKLIQNNIKHLYADVKVRSVFTLAPFASFRTARDLRSHLLRSKLYPLGRKTGSRKCKFQRCSTCKKVQECYTFCY